MKIFKADDWVETIDDHIKGQVTRVDGDQITVMDTDGFEFVFRASELMHQTPGDLRSVVDVSDDIAAYKSESKPKRNKVSKPHKRKSEQTRVIALHIHKLVDSTKGLTNYDMLNLQLDTAKRQLEYAIQNRIPYLVFIHGVGEGVLKMELFTLLRRYDQVQFYDADFKTYGFGATEVRIFQNV